MDEAIMKNRLNDLLRQIDSVRSPDMPESPDLPGCASSVARPCMYSTKDLLDYLGFCLKYLAFDLEATRRENALLRSIIANGEE